MQYTTTDKADARVIESSPAPLPFPGLLDALPTASGVVILTDDLGEVLFVGWDGSIRTIADRAAHNAAGASASRLRWFRTADEKTAKALGKALIRKYRPRGNEDDSQWGVAPD